MSYLPRDRATHRHVHVRGQPTLRLDRREVLHLETRATGQLPRPPVHQLLRVHRIQRRPPVVIPFRVNGHPLSRTIRPWKSNVNVMNIGGQTFPSTAVKPRLPVRSRIGRTGRTGRPGKRAALPRRRLERTACPRGGTVVGGLLITVLVVGELIGLVMGAGLGRTHTLGRPRDFYSYHSNRPGTAGSDANPL